MEILERLDGLAAKYGISRDAVLTLYKALQQTGGKQAQFDIKELGGMGQWMGNGMVMVGDMFNTALKAKVDALCHDLLQIPELLEEADAAVTPAQQAASAIPPNPNAAGAQNGIRYAWFAADHRLYIERDGTVTIYDTGDHVISGVSQQQSRTSSLTFVSQKGTVNLEELPVTSM